MAGSRADDTLETSGRRHCECFVGKVMSGEDVKAFSRFLERSLSE